MGDTMVISAYRGNLIQTVLYNSYGDTWEEAVNGWEITDCVEDRSRKESCICGKEELKHLYEIHNIVADKYLYPTGSSCTTKFERADLYH